MANVPLIMKSFQACEFVVTVTTNRMRADPPNIQSVGTGDTWIATVNNNLDIDDGELKCYRNQSVTITVKAVPIPPLPTLTKLELIRALFRKRKPR